MAITDVSKNWRFIADEPLSAELKIA